MRSPVSITDNLRKLGTPGAVLRLVVCVAFLATNIAAQRVAIIAPQNNAPDTEYAELLSERLGSSLRILDRSQSDTAFGSVSVRNVFNMGLDEAKAAGTVMGCDYFVLTRTGAQRRSSFSRPDYYEAFAVHYVVSTRTGELVSWLLKSFAAVDQIKADRARADSVSDTAKEIVDKVSKATLDERRAPHDTQDRRGTRRGFAGRNKSQSTHSVPPDQARLHLDCISLRRPRNYRYRSGY